MSVFLFCYYCGLLVFVGSCFEVCVFGEMWVMCCLGCQVVVEVIVVGGLESYYWYCSENVVNFEVLFKVFSEELQFYDCLDVQGGFVCYEGELVEISLMIEGISCVVCGWLIEKYLCQLFGVVEVWFNLFNYCLYVCWQDSQLLFSQLFGELCQIGYVGYFY